ncbi:hypothetical protein JOM56_011020 [Amanita muscaria]
MGRGNPRVKKNHPYPHPRKTPTLAKGRENPSSGVRVPKGFRGTENPQGFVRGPCVTDLNAKTARPKGCPAPTLYLVGQSRFNTAISYTGSTTPNATNVTFLIHRKPLANAIITGTLKIKTVGSCFSFFSFKTQANDKDGLGDKISEDDKNRTDTLATILNTALSRKDNGDIDLHGAKASSAALKI